MGIEVVFVLIYPVALICLAAAAGFWFAVLKAEPASVVGYIRGYVPLFAGLAVSVAGLALFTYIDCEADFSSLIQQGYYTEAQRPEYLPARVIGQAIVNLVFVLPAICFVVVPWTTRLIRTDRLNSGGIGLRVVIGWLVLSLLGWLWSFGMTAPSYSPLHFLKTTVLPILLYGLPIPVAALLLFPRYSKGGISGEIL